MSQTAESDSSSDITDDGQYFVPTNGTYLVVQLDPVNMFDPLDDAGIAAAVQALRPKKYIAYVYHIMELPIPKRPDHKCRIALVGRGLCPQDDDARIDASMCVPISPATEHPLSRKPVPTTPPFPFPDCYQYSMAIPTIRIPTKHFYDHTNAVSIPLYDRFPVKIYYSEDHCNRAAQLKAKVEVIAPPLPDKASENQHSARIASSSNTLELGRTVNSAFATVDTPIDVAQPGVDTRHGEPQVACGAEDTRRGDSITDSSPSKPSAPRTMEDDSQDTSPAQVLCLPDVAEVGSVDSASAEAPAVAETARLADDDGSSGSYTPSMIESIADRPRSSSPAPSDLLQQVFLGDPDEDREIIPLVSVSLNLSEVSEGNDPMEFLREMEVIQRLVLEHRSKQVHTEWDYYNSAHDASIDASWVDVAADAPSILEQRGTTSPERTRLSKLCDAVAFKLRTRARHMRRRSVTFLKVVKAVMTCSFTDRIKYTLDSD